MDFKKIKGLQYSEGVLDFNAQEADCTLKHGMDQVDT